MAKQRKKKSSQQSKQESRQHQNEFYKKMHHTMLQLGDREAYSLLNKDSLTQLYYARIRPFKVTRDSGAKMDKKSVEVTNKFLSNILRENVVEIGKDKKQFSLYDFAVYVETLFLFWRNAIEGEMENASRFKACFSVFDEEYKTKRIDTILRIEKYINTMASIYSDVLKLVVRYVRVKTPETISALSDVVFHNNYLLEEFQPVPELLTIDGHARSIYPVYLIRSDGFEHMEIQPERLGNKSVLNKLPLKVYVQLHVLERMYERLGRHFATFNYNYIVFALSSNEVVATGSKNSFLFPLNYAKVRLGYLKGDIIGNKLVARTFLFLTNNGTPEGKKLQELIGLEKEDKKYLGIDQLGTFINSDIKNNEKLKNLFTEAGCGDLFSLDKKVLGSQKKEVAIADFLSQYIGV